MLLVLGVLLWCLGLVFANSIIILCFQGNSMYSNKKGWLMLPILVKSCFEFVFVRQTITKIILFLIPLTKFAMYKFLAFQVVFPKNCDSLLSNTFVWSIVINTMGFSLLFAYCSTSLIIARLSLTHLFFLLSTLG